jgi:hypothetical protein
MIAAAGSGVPAVVLELLRGQPRLAGFFLDGVGYVR